MAFTSSQERRRPGYPFVRRAILDAARELMRVEGVGALSLNEVARRVGMKTPSLYTYFSSKHDLYDALFLEGVREYRRRLADLAQHHSFEGDLNEVAMADYMAFADENPDLYQLVFERPVPGFVPSAASLTEAAAMLADAEAMFARAIESGVIASGLSPAATRDLWIALAHGLTALKRANEPEASRSEGRFGPLIPAAAQLLRAAWIFSAKGSAQ